MPEQLEENGIVSEGDGAKPREVLIKNDNNFEENNEIETKDDEL